METLTPSTTYTAIVGRILALDREKMELEQQDIAKALNISQPAWSRIERGQSVINVEQLRIVSKYLGTSASEVIRRADMACLSLEQRNVSVLPSSQTRNSNNVLALIGIAALTTLVISALAGR